MIDKHVILVVHDELKKIRELEPWLSGRTEELKHASEKQQQEITERKEADQALRESEAKFRTLFESAHDSIFLMDQNVFIDCNQKTLELFGCTRNQIIRQTPDLFSPKVQPDGRASMEKAQEKIDTAMRGQPQFFEWKHCRYDGTLFDAEVSLNAFSISGKKYLQATVHDITERKRAEEALRTSQLRLLEAMDLAHTVYWEFDPAAQTYIFNDPFYAFYGTTAAQESGYLVSREDYPKRFIHPDDISLYYQFRKENALRPDTDLFADFEHRIIRRNGEVRNILVRVRLIRDDSGRIVKRYGVNQDITERKGSEEALRISQLQLLEAMDLAHIVYWEFDPAAQTYIFNDPFYAFYGTTAEQEGGYLVSREDYAKRFIHPDDIPLYYQFVKEHQLRPDTQLFADIEHRIIRRNGEVQHILARARVIKDDSGRIVKRYGVNQDITERKRAGDEREKMLLWQQGVNLLQQSLLPPAPLEEKLRAITDSIVSLFDADFCRIWLIQPGDLCEQGCVHAEVNEGPHICRYRDSCLHLLASSGRYTHTDGTIHRRVPFGCYKIGRIASDEGHKFLTNDVQNDLRVHNNEWARELGLISFVGYQLRVANGKTLGVLALFAKHPILSPEDTILDGLSSAVALIFQRDLAEESLRQTLESLHKSIGTTIQVMVSAVEARDPYTAGHQLRSADLSRAIAMEMGLPLEKVGGIRIAASIHDIGKLSIPAEILSRPAKLSEIEFCLIKEHSKRGYEILKNVESSWPLAEVVYQHHERMDGSGYPRNLKGDDILMEARILAVADVLEAMVSHRPYRPALGVNTALEEITKNRGTLYDAAVVDACLSLFRDKGFRFKVS
jgi:PAS domain S-box-containing protein